MAIQPDSTANIIPVVSAIAAVISAIVSLFALAIAKRSADFSNRSATASERSAGAAENSVNMSIAIFKRQGVIDLHMAWQGVNAIDPSNPIGPDVVRAVNALELTASLWNHDVIEKDILYQSYWGPYSDLFETLHSSSTVVPGLKKTCRELLTKQVIKAYDGMKAMDLETVRQSTLRP